MGKKRFTIEDGKRVTKDKSIPSSNTTQNDMGTAMEVFSSDVHYLPPQDYSTGSTPITLADLIPEESLSKLQPTIKRHPLTVNYIINNFGVASQLDVPKSTPGTEESITDTDYGVVFVSESAIKTALYFENKGINKLTKYNKLTKPYHFDGLVEEINDFYENLTFNVNIEKKIDRLVSNLLNVLETLMEYGFVQRIPRGFVENNTEYEEIDEGTEIFTLVDKMKDESSIIPLIYQNKNPLLLASNLKGTSLKKYNSDINGFTPVDPDNGKDQDFEVALHYLREPENELTDRLD